jgi:photosystem II stability/assembly factor-like uncharacterized protein
MSSAYRTGMITLAALLLATTTLPGQTKRPATPAFDAETISGLGARNIGSATMSGRIAAVDAVHEGSRLTIYVGAASGGVWKSLNGGTTFKPVFDKQHVQSIGAVTIDPTNPKVVWVGTGESWMRNSVSVGDGIYKSTDGGDNWVNTGLKESEHIAKILVDPMHPDTVYAAVPGKLWSDSNERGVFKTTDGGKSWKKILAGPNASTGSSMIAMDRRNPQTVFAGMWDFRRKGWTFRSGGDSATAPSGSGLFKTDDGGNSWTSLDDKSAPGLPAKPWGRVAVSVAPSHPDIVYAFIEAVPPLNGLYRSDDGGKTLKAMDRSRYMVWRPFYFANLIIDPKDPNKLYKPDLTLIMSNNGGASFSPIGGGAHGDFHDVWVDPENTERLITGDDGGLWFSYDGGNNWWKANNLPISQFYHVSVDMDRPYKVYGGLQDNSSWVGYSEYPGGIANSQWENMYGGDGFWMFADPTNPDYLYAEAQGGYVGRVNRKTHESRDLQPLPGYKEEKLRFNWNTPIHMSPTDKGVLYVGSQYLFRSKDFGQTWDRISPDLSTNDPEKQKQEQSGGVTVDNSAAETHTTIYAIAESPTNHHVIWVGTDDGNVQVTKDGGKTWSNVTANIKHPQKNSWVSSIDAGHFAEGTAFITLNDHTSGDMRPHAYRTTNFGKTWERIVPADGGVVKGYAHVVKEDPVNPKLLFLGTEFGLWVSIDGGSQWAQFTGGDFPWVAVHDLAVHPRDHDLVIATHGRGIWIIDDITPLRALTAETIGKDIAFLPSRPTVQKLPAGGGWANGDAVYTGPNPPDDAVITYYQRKRHIFGDLTMEVFDGKGTSLGTIPTSKRKGINRTNWSMRMKAPRVPSGAVGVGAGAYGPRYVPGKYTLKLTSDTTVVNKELVVTGDPRAVHTQGGREQQFALMMKLYGLLEEMTFVTDRMRGAVGALQDRAGKLPAGDALAVRLKSAAEKVDGMVKSVVASKEGGAVTGEERLREFVSGVYGSLNGYEGEPTKTQAERVDALVREFGDLQSTFAGWVGKDLKDLNVAMQTKSLEPVKLLDREDWEKATTKR